MGPEPIVIHGVSFVTPLNGLKKMDNWGYNPISGVISLLITGVSGPLCRNSKISH